MWICREGDEREGGEGGRTEWEGGYKGRREGGGIEEKRDGRKEGVKKVGREGGELKKEERKERKG